MARTKQKPADWIALIEAGYSLEGKERQWFDNLCDRAYGLLDPSGEHFGFMCRTTPTTRQLSIISAPKVLVPLIGLTYNTADEYTMDITFRQGGAVGTASDLLAPKHPPGMKLVEALFSSIGLTTPDVLFAGGGTETGEWVIFGALFREHRKPTALERKRWPQLAAHLGSGLRLRNKLRNHSPDTLPVAAVLDSGGRMHDGQGSATEKDSRENLREAVQRIEKARTHAGRNEPDAALESWEALVNGCWSLVDRFDSDGKRYVIAVANDPAHPDPRGLTARERQVAEYVGLGRSAKEIGYSLGVSSSAVTNSTSRIQEKLGLASHVELVGFFSQCGPRRKMAEVAVAGERLLVGAYPLVDERSIRDLTEAEREVTSQILAGSTNADIARRRHVSEYTVANQVQAIFRKLEVRSRAELAARLQAGRWSSR